MARIRHDTRDDDKIVRMLQDKRYGSWSEEDGKNVFTPRMSFFDEVSPFRLTTYFHALDADDVRLNLE